MAGQPGQARTFPTRPSAARRATAWASTVSHRTARSPGSGGRILLTIEGMRVATVLSIVLVACLLIAGILTLAVAGLGGSADHPAGSASPEPGRVAAATTGSRTQPPASGSRSDISDQPLVPPRTGRARPANHRGPVGRPVTANADQPVRRCPIADIVTNLEPGTRTPHAAGPNPIKVTAPVTTAGRARADPLVESLRARRCSLKCWPVIIR